MHKEGSTKDITSHVSADQDEETLYNNMKTGKILKNRYQAILQLGYGQFSVTWMFWDLLKKIFVAIKLCKNRNCLIDIDNEIGIMEIIKNYTHTDLRHERIMKIVDFFETELNTKYNRPQKCLVCEVVGQNLYDFMNTFDKGCIPIDKVKIIVRQVLEGLNFVHTKCRIIHTDIKPENILICLNNLSLNILAVEATKKHLESPDVNVSLKPFDYFPWNDKSVQSQQKSENFPNPNQETDFNIKIIDFGSSCIVKKHNTGLITTRPYRAPEVLIDAEYSTPVDIWSTACMAFQLATGDLLFEPPPQECQDVDEIHIGEMMRTLGEIPIDVINTGKYSDSFFKESGGLRNITARNTMNICQVLISRYDWSIWKAQAFSAFLAPMLCYDQNTRATAEECLQHPWLKF